jgi:hypothetical protein
LIEKELLQLFLNSATDAVCALACVCEAANRRHCCCFLLCVPVSVRSLVVARSVPCALSRVVDAVLRACRVVLCHTSYFLICKFFVSFLDSDRVQFNRQIDGSSFGFSCGCRSDVGGRLRQATLNFFAPVHQLEHHRLSACDRIGGDHHHTRRVGICNRCVPCQRHDCAAGYVQLFVLHRVYCLAGYVGVCVHSVGIAASIAQLNVFALIIAFYTCTRVTARLYLFSHS